MANPSAKVSDPQAADAAAKKNGALWYAFKGIGRAYLIKPGTSASSDARVSGVHGYTTIEAALANPNGINAASQLTISQWNEYASLPAGGGTLGVLETVNVTWSGSTATVSTPQNPTTAAAGNALGSWVLGFGNTAGLGGRIVKIGLGTLLVIAGIFRLTGAKNVVAVAAKGALL